MYINRSLLYVLTITLICISTYIYTDHRSLILDHRSVIIDLRSMEQDLLDTKYALNLLREGIRISEQKNNRQ